MRKKIIFTTMIVAMFGPVAFSNCVEVKDFRFKWTAFKTPSKVGVSGSFKNITTKNFEGRQAKDVWELLKGASFTIDSKSVSTKNPARDKTISTHFFHFGSDHAINGRTISVSPKALKVEVGFNKAKQTVPLSPKHDKSSQTLTARGVIDIFDFGAMGQFQALHKACAKLHEGKTWSDVEVELFVRYQACKA